MKHIFHILAEIKRIILVNWVNYIAKYGKSVKDGYKSNAFSPLTWFAIFFVVPLIVFALISKNPIVEYICIALIGVILLFCFSMYIVLVIKDPKLLQSEYYRLEDKKLDMIAQQGEGSSINILDNTGSSTPISGEGGKDE